MAKTKAEKKIIELREKAAIDFKNTKKLNEALSEFIKNSLISDLEEIQIHLDSKKEFFSMKSQKHLQNLHQKIEEHKQYLRSINIAGYDNYISAMMAVIMIYNELFEIKALEGKGLFNIPGRIFGSSYHGANLKRDNIIRELQGLTSFLSTVKGNNKEYIDEKKAAKELSNQSSNALTKIINVYTKIKRRLFPDNEKYKDKFISDLSKYYKRGISASAHLFWNEINEAPSMDNLTSSFDNKKVEIINGEDAVNLDNILHLWLGEQGYFLNEDTNKFERLVKKPGGTEEVEELTKKRFKQIIDSPNSNSFSNYLKDNIEDLKNVEIDFGSSSTARA